MAKEDTDLVRLQVNIQNGTRRRLKALSVELECEMGDITDAVLSHFMPLLSAGKAPASVVAAIQKIKKLREESSGE